ncbi:hypothetical protein [Algicella marina]|uniref:Phage holin family protein n=1 Tax=Algicella marina TaxID=2683284 RepID=A0A6P1T081_9RHOB|nr:hypothetical protein [Algicella marina]QHQ35043.1 hypothetical protein GO499_07460 [Algicella marina]
MLRLILCALSEPKAAETAGTVVFTVLAAVFGVIGLYFVTDAAWLYLAGAYNPVVASAVVAGAFLLLALTLVVLSKAKSRARRQAQAARAKAQADRVDPFVAVAQAFAMGQAAGQAFRKSPPR